VKWTAIECNDQIVLKPLLLQILYNFTYLFMVISNSFDVDSVIIVVTCTVFLKLYLRNKLIVPFYL